MSDDDSTSDVGDDDGVITASLCGCDTEVDGDVGEGDESDAPG